MKELKHCFTCGGLGFEDKVCPECGREPKVVSLNLDKKNNADELVRKFDGVAIPNYYHGIFWSKEQLQAAHKDKLPSLFDKESNKPDDQLFRHYCDQLDKINRIFSDNRIPHKSAIIVAPAGFSKITFAYSCMQRALNAGFTVAPLMDTGEIKRILILASENVHYRINKSMSYEDFIMSDVMFVTVTKLYTKNEAYQIIEELFDRRSRKGLSTIFLSRYELSELSKTDASGNFNAIELDSRDGFKYPAVIQYRNRYRRS